ncbi:gamma-aminobutyric acid receptor subunit beta-1-like isoform X2 [Biomphalaria pfeifferi]|uniref:Gamma-aminobutyric acid receptor subunit beta-1-like isoform X2 n=1 Tax=Biomphalaria pfeifferi TaxID=112525 RepID=A0AAD8CDU1_BIOPF|nr:gamma-aminobutyric acid receptor subunit beta-1-like isoform X2 [Biomphalaria pfeifferi]
MDQSNSALITDTADDSRRYKKPKKEGKKGPGKKADKKVREKSTEKAKKAKSKGESQKEAKSKGDKKNAKPKRDKKEVKSMEDKKDAKPKRDKQEVKSMENKKAKSKGDNKDVKGKGDKEDPQRKKDKEDTADKADKKHKKRKKGSRKAKKKKGEKGLKENVDQIAQSETEQSDMEKIPVPNEGPDQQNLGTETQPELMKKSIIEAGLSATEVIADTAKEIMALYLKTSKDSMMSLNERGSSIAVQSLPTSSRLDVESSFMAHSQLLPTNSRLDVARSFIADGQTFPTSSRLNVERSFIADGQLLPTGSRLDVARSFIDDGKSIPTSSRLNVERSFIADGQSIPTSSRLDVERSFIADGQLLPTSSRLDVERSSVYYGSYYDFEDPRPDVRGYSQDFYLDAPRSSQSGDRPEDKFDSKSYYDSRRSSKRGDRPEDKFDLDRYDTRKDSAVSTGSSLSAKNVKDSEPNSQYEWMKERTPYMSGQKQPSGSSVTSIKEIKDISSQRRPPRTYSIMSQGASLPSINERWENETRKKTKQKSERQSVSFEVLDRRQSVDLFNETRDQLNEAMEKRKSSGNAMEMKERVDVDTSSEPSEKMTYEQPGEEQTSQPSDPESSARTFDSSSHTEDAASSSAVESSDENWSDGRANLSAISEASATTESGSSQYTTTSSEVGTQTPATTSSMSLSTDEQASVTSGSATTGTSSSVGAESDSELELELRRESGTWTRLKNNEDVTSYKGMKRHMMENQMENQIVNKEPERRSSEASKPSSMSKMLIDSTSPIKPSSKSMMIMDSTSPIATPRIESGNVAVAGSRRGIKTAIDNTTSVTSPKTYNVIVTTPQPKYKITHCHIVKPQGNDVCPEPRRHEPIKDTVKKVASAGASHDDSSTEISSSEPSSPAPPKKRSSFFAFAPKKSRQHHQKGKKAPEKPSDEKAAFAPGSYAQSPSPQSTGNDEAIAAIVSVTQETSAGIAKATNEMRDAISKLAQMLNNISIGIRNLATSSSDPKSRKEDKSEQKAGYNNKQPSATGFIYSEIQYVEIKVVFIRILEIDTLNQNFEAEVYIQARWAESQFAGLSEQQLSAIEFTDCWNPCLKILNANGTLESERTSMLLQYEPDRVYPVLTYMWHVRGIFREHLELQHFPFDVQELSLVLSSDLHMNELELISDFFHPSHVDERALQESQDFIAYRHVEFTRDFTTLDLMGKTKHPILTASAHVKRRLGFYFWNVVVIVLLIIGLSMCVLAIEPSSTDRLALLLTLFLTAVAFKLVVKTTLPTISYLTYLDIYVVFTLIYLFLAAAVSAMMIHLSTFRDKSKILLYDEIAQSLLISLLILFHLIFLIYIQLTALKRRREMKRKDHEHLLSHFKKQGPMFPTEKQTQTSVSIDRKPGDPPFGAR